MCDDSIQSKPFQSIRSTNHIRTRPHTHTHHSRRLAMLQEPLRGRCRRRRPHQRRMKLPVALLLLLLLGTGVSYGTKYDADEEVYWEADEEQTGPTAAVGTYMVLDLDPSAPSNSIRRDYMQCFLPFNDEGEAAWRVVDRGMQVTLDLSCLLAHVPEGELDRAPSGFEGRKQPRRPDARLPLLRVGEEYACEESSTGGAITTCYGRFAPLLLEAASSRLNGYHVYSRAQLDLQDDLLDLCAYYTEARDHDDCVAAFYDWEDLTEQFTTSPDPALKPKCFAERRELREEVIFRLYLETPEFVSGDMYARLDEARKADLAAVDREVNGNRMERRRKVLVDGTGRVLPDVDPKSVVLSDEGQSVGRGRRRDGGGRRRGDGEGWSSEEEEEEGEEEGLTAAEAAALSAWDEEGASWEDSVFFERSLHPSATGHKWWPPPPPPPPGAAFGGGMPPLMGGLAGEEEGEPPHGPEEEQLLLTKIVKDVFATAPPQGEGAAARLEDPFEQPLDEYEYWEQDVNGNAANGGYYDDPAGYEEAMLTGVSPSGQLEPMGEEILDEYYWSDLLKMPDNVTEAR